MEAGYGSTQDEIMVDDTNNRIAILDTIDEALQTVEALEDIVMGVNMMINPPEKWTANIMPLADPCDEIINDTGHNGGWDGQGKDAPVPVLELNTFTLQIEVCRAGSGQLRELMRIEAAIVKALHAADWRAVSHSFTRDGTAWNYPDAQTSTGFTFCAIQLVVEWFSGRGDLAHQPV